MALAFMKSGGKKSKQEIKIENNNGEKETVKKALIENTVFETMMFPAVVILGCMMTAKKEDLKNNIKETLACTGILSGVNLFLSGLINKSMYDKYNQSIQNDNISNNF